MNLKSICNKCFNLLPNVLLVVLAICMVIFRFPTELELLTKDAFYQKPGEIPEQIKIIKIDEKTLLEMDSRVVSAQTKSGLAYEHYIADEVTAYQELANVAEAGKIDKQLLEIAKEIWLSKKIR